MDPGSSWSPAPRFDPRAPGSSRPPAVRPAARDQRLQPTVGAGLAGGQDLEEPWVGASGSCLPFSWWGEGGAGGDGVVGEVGVWGRRRRGWRGQSQGWSVEAGPGVGCGAPVPGVGWSGVGESALMGAAAPDWPQAEGCRGRKRKLSSHSRP